MAGDRVGHPLTPELLKQMNAFTEFPATPEDFSPSGNWVNLYKVWTCHGYLEDGNETNGFLRIERLAGAQPGGPFKLIIDQEITDDVGIVNVIHAEIECSNDQIATLQKWDVSSRFTENEQSLKPDCDIEESCVKNGAQLEIQRGEKTLIAEGADRLTADWCVFELVQRLAFQEGQTLTFSILEGLGPLKKDQALSYRGADSIELNGVTKPLYCFQQIGSGILPYEYWLDENHRLMTAIMLSRAYVLVASKPTTAVDPETIFETFDDDPETRPFEDEPDWVNLSTDTSGFNFNTNGWLDAGIARDEANRALYYKKLSGMYDKTIEFWWEMDLQMVSSEDTLAQCLFGVFNINNDDNHHNVIADRFFYVEHSSGPRGNRHDVYGWDSEGDEKKKNGAPYEPGIPYGKSVRVKGHYWYDDITDIGKAVLSVCGINADGSTGDAIMSTGTGTVIEEGKSLSFNVFGLGNRTNGSLRNQNQIKVDNLYFSNESENQYPILPSFGV